MALDNSRVKGFNLNNISRYRQELFGIAITLVVIFHFAGNYYDYFSTIQSESWGVLIADKFIKYVGSVGVEIFIILSGMVQYYSFSKNSNVLRYYTKRLTRVLIPYIIVGGFFWIIKDVILLDEGWQRFLLDFSFATFFTEGVRTLWYILLIVFLYLIVPILYKLIYENNHGVTFFIVLTLIGITIPILMAVRIPDIYANIEIAITRVPLFIIGFALGKSIEKGQSIPHLSALLVIVITFSIQYYVIQTGSYPYEMRYAASLFSIGIIIIICYLLHVIDNWSYIRTTLRFLGKYSLEIYLLHVTLRNLMKVLEIPRHDIKFFGIMMAFTLAISPGLAKITAAITNIIGESRQNYGAE